MRGKRGEGLSSMLLYLLFELAIIALFLTATLSKVNSAVKDQTYYQLFISRDVALTADAIQAAEGDFSMRFSYSTPKESHLDILLNQSKADVRLANDTREGTTFPYGTAKDTAAESAFLENSTNSMTDPDKGIFSREFTMVKSQGRITLEAGK